MREPIDLFAQLPSLYRLRDAQQGGPLEALLALVSEQAGMLRDDLDGMRDDLFVETAAEWVVPYIGDLVANTPLHEVPGVGRRADVADTIRWRRRKGTLAMLGDLARHATGWGAHAVAMFELLGWNQHLGHLRMQDAPGAGHPFAQQRVGSVDVRARDALDRIDGAFETITHNVDVRTIADDEGWYGIRKLCIFCFRLVSHPVQRATPSQAPGQGPRSLHVHPLGQDAPLFHHGTPLATGQAFATEANVDAPIRPYRLYEQPQSEYEQSLTIHHGTATVPVADILCKNLASWPAVPADMVAVDVRTGRVRIGDAYPLAGDVRIDACYGFSAPIGGGPYARTALAAPTPPALTVTVAADGSAMRTTLEAAVALWKTQPIQGLRIVISDSHRYTPPGGSLALDRPAAATPLDISIEAGDGRRPVIEADLKLAGTLVDRFRLDGLLVSGQVVVSGPVRVIAITDTTLAPGIGLTEPGEASQPARASLVVDEPSDRRDIELERSITGPLRLPAEGNHVALRDSILDAPAGAAPRVAFAADDGGTVAGPPATFERCTVFGAVFARELALVSESIVVAGPLVAERRQTGCVRFSSFEPDSSSTPRRYRCQPDLVRAAASDPAEAASETERVRPTFTTTRYGQPAYAQLSRACATEIRAGAEDGAEMGAFHLLLQPYRETNLRVRLGEYLPFGLEPGIVHVT